MARGSGRGYVQRSMVFGRHTYVQRTYLMGGRTYVRAYRPVMYRGVPLHFYAPMRYYPGAFYSWAGSPWYGDVAYSWDWAGDPWYGYYGSYFRPARAYSRPSLWLTDFLVGSTLQAAFQACEDAHASAAGAAEANESGAASAPMSDEVKEMVEGEVKRQLAEAQAEARAQTQAPAKEAQAEGPAPPSSDAGLPTSFSAEGPHVFLVSDLVEVRDSTTGNTCVIGGGDAIQLNGGLPGNGGDPTLRVLSSKGSDCTKGSMVTVPLAELVEMHNSMRETVERGLEALRSAQGTGSLPVLPDAAAGAPVPAAYAAQMQADPDAVQVIQEETVLANKIEGEAPAGSNIPESATPLPPAGLAEPSRNPGLLATIRQGQSEADVIGVLGHPRNVTFQGGMQKLYEYPDGRVAFSNGEVVDVHVTGAGAASGRPAGQPASNLKVAAPPSAPKSMGSILVGQSERDVIGVLGRPLSVSFQPGLRKVYEYRNRKIVFVDGAVSEVQ